MKEYHGFQDMKALAIVKPPKGARRITLLAGWGGKPVNMANQTTQIIKPQPVKNKSVNQSISEET